MKDEPKNVCLTELGELTSRLFRAPKLNVYQRVNPLLEFLSLVSILSFCRCAPVSELLGIISPFCCFAGGEWKYSVLLSLFLKKYFQLILPNGHC